LNTPPGYDFRDAYIAAEPLINHVNPSFPLEESQGFHITTSSFDRLYHIGGQIAPGNYGCIANVFYYDIRNNVWVKCNDLPNPVAAGTYPGMSHSAFVVDGTTVWMLGGYVNGPGKNPSKVYSTTLVGKYDTLTDTWVFSGSGAPNAPPALSKTTLSTLLVERTATEMIPQGKIISRPSL
jgi:hypothetical protein